MPNHFAIALLMLFNAKKLPSETRPDALDLLAEGMKLYHEQCQYIQSMHEGSNESAATFPAQTLPGGGTMIRTDIGGKKAQTTQSPRVSDKQPHPACRDSSQQSVPFRPPTRHNAGVLPTPTTLHDTGLVSTERYS
jgi:hypothetical protein